MAENWIINSAKTVGRSHVRDNLPCQDSVMSKIDNGVSVIALSDGCGSSPISQYGSEITVNAVCNLMTQHFEELYSSDDLTIKKSVVAAIVEQLKKHIHDNPELIAEYNQKNPGHFEKFKSRWPGYAQAEKIYPLTLFDATVQFVATKGNHAVIGRLGDGIIGDVCNDTLRILSSEDKVGVERNVTWYPTAILLASENTAFDPWAKFEIIKSDKTSENTMFMIVSDGAEDVICGEDGDAREKFLYPDEIENLLKNSGNLYSILENDYKPIKGIYDDLSIILMQKPSVNIKKIVLRQYDEEGRTISNSKIHELEASKTIEEPCSEIIENDRSSATLPEADGYSLNLLDSEANERIARYIVDLDYRAYFIEQASKVQQYLDKSKAEHLDKMFALLQPNVDEDDWQLLLRQFSKLRLFSVDRAKKLISKKEKQNATQRADTI